MLGIGGHACQARAAGNPAIVVDHQVSDAVVVTQALKVYRDSSGRQTIAEVARLSDDQWQTLTAPLAFGFTADTVWLRFVIRNASPSRSTWWLDTGQPLLGDVRLFEGSQTQGFRVMVGRDPKSPQASVQLRRALFALDLEGFEQREFFLRITAEASMAVTPRLWQPLAFAQAEERDTYFWGSVFGAYIIVALFYAAFWVWTRERIHLVYTLYVSGNLLAAVFSGGWVSVIVPTLSFEASQTLLGVWISLSISLGTVFSLMFLEADKVYPRLQRSLLTLAGAVTLTGLVLVLTDHYRSAMPIVQISSMLIIVSVLVLALVLLIQGQSRARFFVFAFTFFYVGVIGRYARNAGLLEPTFFTDNAYQLGAFIHMLVMSVGIFAGYNRIRQEKESAETRLATETRLRNEQGEFMAMVSHEFRNPLNVITSSSANLLREPSLDDPSRQRIEKIVKAADRMASLMDTYLAHERLLLDQSSAQPAPNDMAQLVRQAVDDLEEVPGTEFSVDTATPAKLNCDASLLRIALHNLLGNAHKHSAPGQLVHVAVSSDSQWVEVRIRDSGPGVPDDEAALIFERFYRGRYAVGRPGAGLGLYLVRSIARQHGGDVTFRNRDEGGCDFYLRLPVSGTPAMG